jgi:hypothetical protein
MGRSSQDLKDHNQSVIGDHVTPRRWRDSSTSAARHRSASRKLLESVLQLLAFFSAFQAKAQANQLLLYSLALAALVAFSFNQK